MPSRAVSRGLDWLFFFVADLQTGFGPFIAVFLTDHHWTQAQLGLALGMGSAAGMLAQVPAGFLVDALRNKATSAAAALVGICASALLLAWEPSFWPVLLAQAIYGFASCMLNPSLAALTLTLVGATEVAERFGRNARFAAIGSAVGAALMGACGTWISTRAVFWLAGTLCMPALLALRSLGRMIGLPERSISVTATPATPTDRTAPADLIPLLDPRGQPMTAPTPGAPVPATPAPAGLANVLPTPSPDMPEREPLRDVISDRRLLAYIGCVFLFHLSNAAMLPLAAVEITKRADEHASLIIAACILVPQLLVALVSPLAGRMAERWGRRIVLLVGFCALPARAALLAWVTNPYGIIPVQALDGLGGAVFGVMTPLVAADIAGSGGHFNLRMGILGLAIGIAATLSNTAAGAIASGMGSETAFFALALAGLAAVAMVGLAMPETRKLTGGIAVS